MSETSKKVNLDVALREWPDVEKSATELDESAQAIVHRIQSGERGRTAATLSDENLLAAPLGQSTKDGHNSATLGNEQREGSKMTMADRERDRRSLQDLAKMAAGLTPQAGPGLTPPPPSARSSAPSGVQPSAGAAKGDDSGLIDLRAVASEPAPSVAPAPTSSNKAAHVGGLASQGLFDEEPVSMKQPAPSLPPMPASMPPQSMPYGRPTPSAPAASVAPVHAAPSIAPAHASSSQPALQANANQKKGNGAVIALVFGGIVALGAAAAGTFFYLKTHKPAAPVAATQAPPPDVKPITPPPATAAAPTDPTPATEPTMDPNALPTATPDNKLATASKTGHVPKPGAHSGAAPAPEAPKPEAKLTQKDLPTAPTGPAGDLGKAMGQAVGDDGKPKTQEMTQAAGTNVPAGSVPQKPSQGAVTGAIGAVLRQARECLGPDDPVSHANVTFSSDGSVSSVAVTGAAAGKPAEACIKAQLSKAKVGPFAEPSYSTRITVRHN